MKMRAIPFVLAACVLSAQDDFEKQMRSVISAYAIAAENFVCEPAQETD